MRYYFYTNRGKHKHNSKDIEAKVGEMHYGKYTREFDEICNVLYNHPYTWNAYAEDGEGLLDVIKMEFDELWTAYKAGNYEGQVENFIHVAAACIRAHNRMTCDK